MELTDYLRYAAALGVVVGLILACAWAARRFGLAPGLATAGAERRLAIVSQCVIDARHRLVLVRRDATEHLLLLGPSGATLVEGGIDGQPARNPVDHLRLVSGEPA